MPRRSILVLVACVTLLTAACGTRVPDEAFRTDGGRSGAPSSSTDAGDGTFAAAPRQTRDRTGSTAGQRTSAADATGSNGSDSTSSPSSSAGNARPTTTATSGGGAASGPGGSQAQAQPDQSQPNQASDVGVTGNEIRVGIIASKSGPLGASIFMPSYYGVNAFFQRLNARGGVHGRSVRLIWCDDAEDRSRNQQCVHRLIDDEKVFALVGNATRSYAGAGYVAQQGVPDVGGQPVGNAYYRYPTHFAIRGDDMPRDGKSVGIDGDVYLQTLQFRFIKQKAGVTKAAIVHYNVPQSQSYASYMVDAMKKEGITPVSYEVNLAFPNFDSVVADMRAQGVDGIWDVMDATGNRNLCEAMSRASFSVKAKVGTTQQWSRGVGRQLPDVCRKVAYEVGESRPNADTSNPQVDLFRKTMTTVYNGAHDDTLHQWSLEGWAAAKLFTEGVESMGAAPTRQGLMDWLNGLSSWDGDGLLTPIDWQPDDVAETGRECLSVAKWNDDVENFTAVAPVPYCEDGVPFVSYRPAS